MKESAYINRKVNMAPQEEIAERERQYRLYDYYGIPYLMLDDAVEYDIQKDIDRNHASDLIMRGLSIPKDLDERLLRYKREDEERLKANREREHKNNRGKSYAMK